MTNPAVGLPRSFDLRSVNGQNYITEVRDQKECNSCTAYAVVAAIEGAISIKNGVVNPTIHLSENQLFFCGGSNGCDTNAWYPEGALKYCKDTGITDATTYSPVPFGICDNALLPVTKISNYRQLPDATAIKQCLTGLGLYAQSPVVAVFVLYESLYAWNANNVHQVYKVKDKDPFEVRRGGHVVCIVGYDDADGHWICKNSWGPSMGGLGGYYNIGYGECHIDDFLMYGIVA